MRFFLFNSYTLYEKLNFNIVTLTTHIFAHRIKFQFRYTFTPYNLHRQHKTALKKLSVIAYRTLKRKKERKKKKEIYIIYI